MIEKFYALIEDKYKFLITDEEDLPTQIRIDMCNICQLNCAACWMRKNEKIIKEHYGGFGYVKFETFKDFIDKHPFIKEIEMADSGEVFLNPDLEKIIEYASDKDIILKAQGGTNFNYLSENMPETLVRCKFNKINIAIDGATPETYAIYRRKGDFNKVIENIKKVNYFKEKYNSEFPRLVYRFILFGHNEHEVEQAKQLAKELNMTIDFGVNCVKGYSPIKNIKLLQELTGIDDVDNHWDFQYNNMNLTDHAWFYCSDLFNYPQINWNGDLKGCCISLFDGTTLGVNVFKEGLQNALNNEKVLYAKQMLLDFSIHPRDDIPCSHCHIYKFLKNKSFQSK